MVLEAALEIFDFVEQAKHDVDAREVHATNRGQPLYARQPAYVVDRVEADLVDDRWPEKPRALVTDERLGRDVELGGDRRDRIELLRVRVHQRAFASSASSWNSSRSRSVSIVGT